MGSNGSPWGQRVSAWRIAMLWHSGAGGTVKHSLAVETSEVCTTARLAPDRATRKPNANAAPKRAGETTTLFLTLDHAQIDARLQVPGA